MKQSPLFRNMEQENFDRFVASGEFTRYHEGDLIINEGEIVPEMFIVAEGTVHVMVRQKEKDVFICAIGEGEIFGEAGLFSKVRRTASVSAASDTVLFRVTKPSLTEFLRKNHGPGMQILLVVIYSLLRKLREVNHELAYERRFDVAQEDIDAMIHDVLGK